MRIFHPANFPGDRSKLRVEPAEDVPIISFLRLPAPKTALREVGYPSQNKSAEELTYAEKALWLRLEYPKDNFG